MCHSNSDFVHVKCIFNLFSSKRIAVTRAQNGATHLTMHGNDFRTEIVRWGELELNGNKRTWIEWLEKWWLKLPKMFVRITSHGFRFRLRSMEASGACARRALCVWRLQVCTINMSGMTLRSTKLFRFINRVKLSHVCAMHEVVERVSHLFQFRYVSAFTLWLWHFASSYRFGVAAICAQRSIAWTATNKWKELKFYRLKNNWVLETAAHARSLAALRKRKWKFIDSEKSGNGQFPLDWVCRGERIGMEFFFMLICIRRRERVLNSQRRMEEIASRKRKSQIPITCSLVCWRWRLGARCMYKLRQ